MNLNTSPPGAKVVLQDQTIGRTPIVLNGTNLKNPIAGGHLIHLEYEGYKRLWIWLPDGIRGLDFVLNLEPFRIRPEESLAVVDEPTSRSELYKASWDLLRAQTTILATDSKGESTDETLKAYEGVGAAGYLSAIKNIKEGNLSKAKESLELAVTEAPREADFLALLNELNAKEAKK